MGSSGAPNAISLCMLQQNKVALVKMAVYISW
jgi:hypothetical protein